MSLRQVEEEPYDYDGGEYTVGDDEGETAGTFSSYDDESDGSDGEAAGAVSVEASGEDTPDGDAEESPRPASIAES